MCRCGRRRLPADSEGETLIMLRLTTGRSLRRLRAALLMGGITLCTAAATLAIGVLGAAQPPAARLLEGLGSYRLPVATASAEAQRFFDQGMTLAFGFNHAESLKAFQEAARLDPDCAMCWWGVALVQGPNYNAPMDPAAEEDVLAAMRRAQALAPRGSDKEQALIAALAHRYAPGGDRAALDKAYADAMRDVAYRLRGDADVLLLYAEAMMTQHPWDLWTRDGQPQPWTPEIVAALEAALAINPDHPGALHMHIHAVEASPTPERGVASADRLLRLVPAAGHLVHMPSHIYIRVGRYADAAASNESAIAADIAYIARCQPTGIYVLGYVPHNQHFLWAAATFGGQSAKAIATAERIRAMQDQQLMRQPGFTRLQHFWVTPYLAQVRFGRWADILAAPMPEPELVYPRAMLHYARGLALLRTGRAAEAEAELAALQGLAADPRMAALDRAGVNPMEGLPRIAALVLGGELAAARGDTAAAVAQLRAAGAAEDALLYSEPATWHHPTRQVLGAVLLQAGRAAEAEAVYREDLALNTENGWSLFGLARSLAAQGRAGDADAVMARFAKAWTNADIRLTDSRL